MRKKNLAMLFLALSSVPMNAAVDAEPLQNTTIDTNVSGNITSTGFPFLVYKKNNVSASQGALVVGPDLEFPPKKYSETVTVRKSNQSGNNTYTDELGPYEVNILKVANWSSNPDSVERTLNVGSSGDISTIFLNMTGNEQVKVSTKLSGNATSYLDVSPTKNIYPNINTTVVVSYQIPRSTAFGFYRSELKFSTSNRNDSVELKLHFKDNISPEIEDINYEDFAATKPENFTVVASDNHEIDSVKASVLETVENPDPNKTGQINQTVKSFTFTNIKNTDKWSVKPEIDETGEFYLRVNATDKAGNTVSDVVEFRVTRLNVIRVSDLSLEPYRKGVTIRERFGRIERKTGVSFRLESFNQPLKSTENETWGLGIHHPGGRDYFNSVNDTIEVDQSGQLDLVVDANVEESFNGEISVQPDIGEKHVDVEPVTFSGSFLDCPVMHDVNFTVFGKKIRGVAENAESCVNAGLKVSYKLNASSFEDSDSIEDSFRIYLPQQVKETTVDAFKNDISRLKSKVLKVQSHRLLLSVAVVGMIAVLGFVIRILPTWSPEYPYFTERMVERTERKIYKKELGMEEA